MNIEQLRLFERFISRNTIVYPETITKIKKTKVVNTSTKQCCICLDKYIINDITRILPCGHIFHNNCISVWLSEKHTCPICREKTT
jgi:hypothetical protein